MRDTILSALAQASDCTGSRGGFSGEPEPEPAPDSRNPDSPTYPF